MGATEEKKDEAPKNSVPYFKLYRFATCSDKLMIAIGWLMYIVVGICEPLMIVFFGGAMREFVSVGKLDPSAFWNVTDMCKLTLGTLTDTEKDMFEGFDDGISATSSMMKNIWWFVGLGATEWITGWIGTWLLMLSAENQINRIRAKYFASVVRQDMSYFDTVDVGEINARMFEDIKKIQEGIADKVGMVIQSIFQTVAGLAIALYFGWELGLVCIATIPLIALGGFVWMVAQSNESKKELDNYTEAGGVAEEVLASIKTVTAFNGQSFENGRYSKPLAQAQSQGIKKAAMSGFAVGFFNLSMFAVYGIAFWYGSEMVIHEGYDVGTKIIVFFSVLIGGFAISMVATNAEYLGTATTAAYSVFELIDRVPEIDIYSEEGAKPVIQGTIEFQNVDFTYPSRKEQGVLSGVSFKAEAGKTTALCGASGCGKSTCFQLIQRFYDAAQGRILIDGQELKSLNLAWFRENIGVVSQEPVLFDGTVEENITLGRLDVTKEEITEACKQANALDFIQKLPSTWETNVGEGGATLSGGQKQRIAIARALVRNPKILLLDEATSALDTESEKIVQQALEKASVGRTTLVIAHRLSTIKNADKIIGFKNGKKMEEGNHASLQEIEDGVYKTLCNMQSFSMEQEKVESETSLKGAESNNQVVEAKKSKESSVEESEKSEKKKDGEEESEEEIAKREGLPEVGFGQILGMNSPEWFYITIGSIFALFTGAVQPLWALIFAGVLDNYSQFNCVWNEKIKELDSTAYANGTADVTLFDELTIPLNITEIKENHEWCDEAKLVDLNNMKAIEFVIMGVALFFGFGILHLMFGISDMSYFDEPLNSTGNLTARLASDAGKVQGATGRKIGEGVMNLGAFGCGLGIAFYYSWQLSLAVFAFMPVIIITNALMMQVMMNNHGDGEQKNIEEASKVATETTNNIRTVAGLGREKHFCKLYSNNMDALAARKGKTIFKYGLLYGATLGCMHFMYATTFWFSSWLIDNDYIDSSASSDVMRKNTSIPTKAQSAGVAANSGKANLAARRIVKLFETALNIDPESTEGEKPEIRGKVEFAAVEFSYPTRAEFPVLKGIQTNVEPGQTLALVGQSGCGKSTYTTIRENILYGLDDGENSGKPNKVGVSSISDADIETALREANAYNFVMDLPQRLETRCGKKGSQLSGGQKQRIAIARALIRKPKILLLDEATSALDTESEKIVQDALDKARQGRTAILIAHRLSTVINADVIAVVDNGVIVESGKHQDLIDKRGAYYHLIKSQL
ncbi:Oidioi.mRNA.OKI2018_I69.chr1.g1009.t1.cds [Oikopleura dioica]|uniref:Oidioi.mRNA.OKI2018_I69.chr1.g1009.t1.cds n=1 Tax=Oikopleura dioica TaxID=34765 RepID=A0ABN7SQX5_OIKDI|nr:Oidioi.mRNA.OKI2018_I69.chr1.g1009.t1.cds [Oikopleura dioica]